MLLACIDMRNGWPLTGGRESGSSAVVADAVDGPFRGSLSIHPYQRNVDYCSASKRQTAKRGPKCSQQHSSGVLLQQWMLVGVAAAALVALQLVLAAMYRPKTAKPLR